jgi:hypothetical protein
MRKANLIYSALMSAVIFAGFYPSAAMGADCPPKKLDRKNFPTALVVDEEAISFSYRSKIYPVDIFSAFTKGSSAAFNYCIRYEVVSKAQDAIEKFYWPLSSIQMDTVHPGDRVSLAVTKPPGRDPTIDETWIYAFLNSVVRTSAFQRRAESRRLDTIRVALNTNNNRKEANDRGTELYMQLSAIDTVEQRLELKEPTKFSEVYSQFSRGEADEISSTSEASWDGENSQIQIKLASSDEKTLVFAPITYAFAKASNASDFLGLIREFTFKRQPLPLDKDHNFEFSRKVSPANYAGSRALYVIEQPISLVTPSGGICFTSPMYSPIPVPAEFLQCRLF